MLGVFRQWFVRTIRISAWFFLFGCSADQVSGPIQMQLIQPVPNEHCKYTIAPATISTIQSLNQMKGTVGKVVYSRDNLGTRPEILDAGVGFEPVDVQFAKSGETYFPLDYHSLFAASLYYAIERGHILFSSLDPTADLSRIVPNFSDTSIVHEARRTFGEIGAKPEVTDNAEYLSRRIKAGGQTTEIRNYFFSFPTDTVKDMPLGLNLGIMVHEYTHMVFNYLFYEAAFARNADVSKDDQRAARTTLNTIRSMDEGNADYFGFLASQDPGFFLCSYPGENRDLSVSKTINSYYESIATDSEFDPHVGGAVWAYALYKIGELIGHQQNGQALVKTMANLVSCTTSGTTINMNFGTVANCHLRYLSSRSAEAMRIYSEVLGPYMGGR